MNEKIPFTDCVDLAGSSVKKYDGTRQYVSTGALDCDHIDFSQVEKCTYEDKPSRANLAADCGTILFAKMQGTKKTIVLDDETSGYIYSTGFAAVRAKPDIISERCLYHLVTGEYFLRQKDKYCSGTTQKAITNKGLEKIMISVPDTALQPGIADRLDLLDTACKLCQKILELFDDIIKSRFVEMFGELGSNPKGYPLKKLEELCSKITDGKHGGCETEAGTGRFFVGAREIYDGVVHYDTAPEITVRDFEKDYKRCNIEIGDFLIVNTGATIGKSAIATDERTTSTLLQKSVALLKVRSEQMLPIFLRYCYMENPKMYMVESASAQPNLLLSKIKATTVYVPPIDQQQAFAAFVANVDKSKSVVAKCLHKTEYLKSALMQQYFG